MQQFRMHFVAFSSVLPHLVNQKSIIVFTTLTPQKKEQYFRLWTIHYALCTVHCALWNTLMSIGTNCLAGSRGSECNIYINVIIVSTWQMHSGQLKHAQLIG